MYRKHINLINKLPDYTPQPEDAPVRPVQPAAEPVQAPIQTAAPVEQPAMAAEPVYTPPVPQPAAEPAPAPVQETAYYEEPAPQPAAEPLRPAAEKVDTVEFAIAPHPEESEEPDPVPEMAAPAIEETRFQDVSGLYDEPETKPVRRTRKTGTAAKRTTRKKVSAEPQEELNSPAFDNFEGVDFDS